MNHASFGEDLLQKENRRVNGMSAAYFVNDEKVLLYTFHHYDY
ncbi:MAG TPA: hypothetical protein VK489_06830 [Ferruginibacter sp.]|nr:hypothetical protein [Ferruginibacter sp.]